MTQEIKIGSILPVEIIGMQEYGAFVKFDRNGQEEKGLIHISEVKSGFVKNIRDAVKVGQKVKAQVIDIDEFSGKISLSIRSLEHNPQNHYLYRKKHFTDPRDKIGFKSIAQKLPAWVAENEAYLKTQGKW